MDNLRIQNFTGASTRAIKILVKVYWEYFSDNRRRKGNAIDIQGRNNRRKGQKWVKFELSRL